MAAVPTAESKYIEELQPFVPPTLRIATGTIARPLSSVAARYAPAVVSVFGRTTAAIGPAALIVSEYSPGPRHVADAAAQGIVVPSVNRGSNARDAPAATLASANA